MKRWLTIPLTSTVVKSFWLLITLLVIGMSSAIALFPESPLQLTLISSNQQHYQAQCPALVKVVQTEPSKGLTMPFELLNWNIYKQQKESWRTSLHEWAKRADIITLQEAKLSDELIDFSKQNKLFYLQNYAFKLNNDIYGVNTLSKVVPTSVCGSAHSEPWIFVPKTGIAATYPLQGSEKLLLVINLHGVNFTFTEKPLREQLAPYFSLIEAHQGPIIFSGDFNTWSNARLEGVQKYLIASGFSEALFDQDKRLKVFGLPLDHIYFRGLKVLDAQSLETDSSDHSPQLVTFEL